MSEHYPGAMFGFLPALAAGVISPPAVAPSGLAVTPVAPGSVVISATPTGAFPQIELEVRRR